jgi:uncharacterized protein
MSAPVLTGTEPRLEPLARRWAVLLRTRKRDGSWVGTPVNLAVDGERAYFGTPADSSKVRRLRNFDEVEVAPSTLRGRPVGPPLAARARRLDGDEARAAERPRTSAGRRRGTRGRAPADSQVPDRPSLRGATRAAPQADDERPLRAERLSGTD